MFCYYAIKNTLEKHWELSHVDIDTRNTESAEKLCGSIPQRRTRAYRVRRIGSAVPKIRINQRQGKHITTVQERYSIGIAPRNHRETPRIRHPGSLKVRTVQLLLSADRERRRVGVQKRMRKKEANCFLGLHRICDGLILPTSRKSERRSCPREKGSGKKKPREIAVCIEIGESYSWESSECSSKTYQVIFLDESLR